VPGTRFLRDFPEFFGFPDADIAEMNDAGIVDILEDVGSCPLAGEKEQRSDRNHQGCGPIHQQPRTSLKSASNILYLSAQWHIFFSIAQEKQVCQQKMVLFRRV
jgi:hypothetical protein